MNGSPLPGLALCEAGSQAWGSRMELRPEVAVGRAPGELLQNLQASLSRSRPVSQTGAGAGNLGRGPAWSPGLCLVRGHLSAACPCWGSPGQGRLSPHWLVPGPHECIALRGPWLHPKDPRLQEAK